jgi:hypothetical protein
MNRVFEFCFSCEDSSVLLFSPRFLASAPFSVVRTVTPCCFRYSILLQSSSCCTSTSWAQASQLSSKRHAAAPCFE